jgi:hypothetical protein
MKVFGERRDAEASPQYLSLSVKSKLYNNLRGVSRPLSLHVLYIAETVPPPHSPQPGRNSLQEFVRTARGMIPRQTEELDQLDIGFSRIAREAMRIAELPLHR